MIDFFTALLEPQFSESPLLQPRVPALFEPVLPRREGVVFGEVSEANESEFPREPGGANTPRPGRTPPPEGGQERAPYRGVMKVAPTLRTAKTLESPAPFLDSTAGGQQRADPTGQEAHHGQPVPSGRVSTLQGDPSREQAPREDGGSHAGAIRPASVVEPRGVEPRAGSELQTTATPQDAPVVRIEIGRIVVRAVQPNAERPPQRAPAPAKKLSLDDYLKKHERGER